MRSTAQELYYRKQVMRQWDEARTVCEIAELFNDTLSNISTIVAREIKHRKEVQMEMGDAEHMELMRSKVTEEEPKEKTYKPEEIFVKVGENQYSPEELNVLLNGKANAFIRAFTEKAEKYAVIWVQKEMPQLLEKEAQDGFDFDTLGKILFSQLMNCAVAHMKGLPKE